MVAGFEQVKVFKVQSKANRKNPESTIAHTLHILASLRIQILICNRKPYNAHAVLTSFQITFSFLISLIQALFPFIMFCHSGLEFRMQQSKCPVVYQKEKLGMPYDFAFTT